MKKYVKKINDLIYIYRYDLFSWVFMLSFILWVFEPLFSKGHVVFSDIAFGYYSDVYLSEIFGLWNERWSTSTLLNVPRLLYILPYWILSKLFGGSGPILIKSFILGIIMTSAGSMYLFSKRIVSLYFSKEFDFYKVFALVTGALYYALNPYVIFRIQHIYLLCGYSLFPLLLRLFFDIFDPKFQRQIIKDYDISRVTPYKNNIKNMLVFSLLYSVGAGAIHYFFYGAIYFSVIALLIITKNICVLLPDMEKVSGFIKNICMKLGILITFFVFTSFYWLSNYILSILTHSQASQHNINTVDTISLFSRNSGIKNILYLDSYWWPMFDLTKLPMSFYIGGGILLLFIVHAMLFRAYKYHIIFFFSILSALFVLFSTGTKLESFAPFFVIFVTKTPVIGSMFRDPNKLVGLLAVGFSLLLTFGIEQVLVRFGDSYKSYFMKGTIIVGTIFSLWFYILPFKTEFIDGFYAPVEIPVAMKEVQDNFYDGGEFSRVLYFPIADNMTQSYSGVATPKWNKNPNIKGTVKATGDIHVYTSTKKTIFHHEGNIKGISYFLSYIQNLMDRGLSTNIGKLLRIFPVDEIAYHDEYLGQERRQDFNLAMIEKQEGLKKHYENDIYHLYLVEDPREYLEVFKNKIYTPYGYTKLETYLNIEDIDLTKIPTVFTNQGIDEDIIYEGSSLDYVETETFNDLFLSTLPEKYYSFPFDDIEGANVFLGWGKVLISNNDWMWYLNSQGIDNFPYDFDMGRGIATTFSTSKLNIPPYKFKSLKGDIIADFDSFLRTDKFFKPDNPQLFSVQANPKKATNKIPVLRGEIVKGDPKTIWQVAKSGLIKSKENNPYQFNLVVSGRGANKLHIKTRFFDKDLNEIGTSYVVAPKNEFFFDEMNFYGEYISPPDSEYMRLDILSYQNNKQKNYWWIHDIQIKDLEEYKSENFFVSKINSEVGTKGRLYMRTFISKVGGRLEVHNGEKKIDVNTYSQNLNRLQWIDLGDVTLEDKSLTTYNRKGFNSVNAIVFIPDKDRSKLEYPVKKIIKEGTIFVSLEAESAFEYFGNIQSKRRYPSLSGGAGIRSQNGRLTKKIEVLKDGFYDINLNLDAKPDYGGNLLIILNNDSKENIIEEVVTAKEENISNEILDKSVVITDHTIENFPREIIELEGTLANYQKISLPKTRLAKGMHTLKIKFDSKVPSMSELEDFHKLDPAEMKEPDFFEDIFQEDCSECETIDESMMGHKIITEEKDFIDKNLENKIEGMKEEKLEEIQKVKEKVLYIEFDPTCSCDWYVYATNMMVVTPLHEYMISYEARSEIIEKRHGKVLFLDKEKDVIDIQYIFEVEEQFKDRWNSYEQIFSPPEETVYMQLQIWSRGDKKEFGNFRMKNFSILPYGEFVLLDTLSILEDKSYSLQDFSEEEGIKKNDSENKFFKVSQTDVKVEYQRVDTMKRNLTINNPKNEKVMISYGESPNPLWKESFEGQRVARVVNGLGAYFKTSSSGKGNIRILLREVYYLGILILGFGILLLGGIFGMKLYQKKRKHKNDKKGGR